MRDMESPLGDEMLVRWVAWIWVTFCSLLLTISILSILWVLIGKVVDSEWETSLMAFSFGALGGLGGWGLLKRRGWGRGLVALLSSLLTLYCVAFLWMEGLEFGLIAFIVIMCIGLFSLISLLILLRGPV
jgi:hypothetical protein